MEVTEVNTGARINQLWRKAERFIDFSIADSTRKQYNTGLNKYVSFCREENLRPFPLHEGNVIIFVTSLATVTSYSAINIYLAGIKFVAKRHGFNSDFSKFNRLYLVIRGIKRAHGDQFKKAKRAPVTPNVLMVARCRLFNSSRNFGD